MFPYLSWFIVFIHCIDCIDSRCFGTFPLRGWGNVRHCVRELVNKLAVLPVSRLRWACFFAVSAHGERRNARKNAFSMRWVGIQVSKERQGGRPCAGPSMKGRAHQVSGGAGESATASRSSL